MPKRTAHIFEEKWRSDDVKLQEATDFASLLISPTTLLGLHKAGYKNPSPIQVEAIPVGRFGADLVIQAKSGTGKTLVFTIIALDIISIELEYPQVLILAPTREIAHQICDVIKAVGCTSKTLKCSTFIGGLPIETDLLNIQGCHIVVGTPGRITQLLDLKIFKANSIRLLVLDEADQLLDPSFKSPMDTIFESLPPNKQIVATSATYPKSLVKLVDIYFKENPTLARLNESDLALLGIVHFTCLVSNTQMPVLAYRRKLQALETILTSVKFSQCLIFCNQVSRVEILCSDVKKFGFSATYISSAKDQAERLKAIDCLKRFKCKILVSSDVTSRGIDAENVDLIINVDLPYTTEVYLHRVGRAGRYGSKGVAITLVTEPELLSFMKIQKDGHFLSYDLPDPVPEKLINWRPNTKLLKEKSYGGKSTLSQNQNNSAVVQKKITLSNGIENDTSTKLEDLNDNRSISSEDCGVNRNTTSENPADYQNTSIVDSDNQNITSEDPTDNQNTSSVDSYDNQNISFVDSAANQNTSSVDSAANQNTSSEEFVNQNSSSVDYQNASSEDPADRNSSSEDSAVSTSSEGISENQSRSSEDISANQSTISEDTSNNEKITFNTIVNQNLGFKEISFNQTIDSVGTSSTNTVLTALGVVGQSSVDKYSDKIIGENFDVPSVNFKVATSVDEVDKNCVLNKRKNKKWNRNKRAKASKQKKSLSTAVSSSEQNFSDGGKEGTDDLLSRNEIKKICTDEITVFVMNFIDGYEKKNTADLSCPLVSNEDKSLCLSSDKTDLPNNPFIRRNLLDYYYKVFQVFKSDFIAAHGIKQFELMMDVNEESSIEKKDGKCAALIGKDGLRSKKLGFSTHSASNCTDDSLEDICVSTPNAKASRDNNVQLVVSSDTPPFLNSVNYQDTSDTSGSNYSSKCLLLENAFKTKGTINKTQAPLNPKSKAQKGKVSKTESSRSETTSSSDTDVESKPQNVESPNTESSESAATSSSDADSETTSSSDTDSETSGSSDTDCSTKSDGSSKLTLLERAYKVMMKGDNKPQTFTEQAEQLRQIIYEIQEGGDDESLSGIHIASADAHSFRKSLSSGYKSSVKSNSSKISRNAGCSSGRGNNLIDQQSKYQSDGQEESVSNSSESNSSQKRKVSKLFKHKTCQKSKDLPQKLNRSEGFRVAEHNEFDSSHSHTSRHVDSHLNHWDHLANAVYTGYNISSRPSQNPLHHSCRNHHENCPNRANARQNSSWRPSQCHHSRLNHQGCPRNAAHRRHSRSTQHCHSMNNSSIAQPLSSASSGDMYYRQWYWIQHGSSFQ